MGEIAEMMINGIMCEQCGCWMPEAERCIESKGRVDGDIFDDPPGYPRKCNDCAREEIKRMKHI